MALSLNSGWWCPPAVSCPKLPNAMGWHCIPAGLEALICGIAEEQLQELSLWKRYFNCVGGSAHPCTIYSAAVISPFWKCVLRVLMFKLLLSWVICFPLYHWWNAYIIPITHHVYELHCINHHNVPISPLLQLWKRASIANQPHCWWISNFSSLPHVSIQNVFGSGIGQCSAKWQ